MKKSPKGILRNIERNGPMDFNVVAEEIIKISASVKAMDASRVKRRVIVLLIADSTKLPIRDIEFVLNAISSLDETYLKRPQSTHNPQRKTAK